MKTLMITILVAISGCAYSVKHTPMGQGTYVISAKGMKAPDAVHKRASELCGPAGYELHGMQDSSTPYYYKGGHITSQGTAKKSVIVIKCRQIAGNDAQNKTP